MKMQHFYNDATLFSVCTLKILSTLSINPIWTKLGINPASVVRS